MLLLGGPARCCCQLWSFQKSFGFGGRSFYTGASDFKVFEVVRVGQVHFVGGANRCVYCCAEGGHGRIKEEVLKAKSEFLGSWNLVFDCTFDDASKAECVLGLDIRRKAAKSDNELPHAGLGSHNRKGNEKTSISLPISESSSSLSIKWRLKRLGGEIQGITESYGSPQQKEHGSWPVVEGSNAKMEKSLRSSMLERGSFKLRHPFSSHISEAEFLEIRNLKDSNDLKEGDSGSQVLLLQKALASFGFLHGTFLTGHFGRETKQALEKFQTQNGIDTSGCLDTLSKDALLKHLEHRKDTSSTMLPEKLADNIKDSSIKLLKVMQNWETKTFQETLSTVIIPYSKKFSGRICLGGVLVLVIYLLLSNFRLSQEKGHGQSVKTRVLRSQWFNERSSNQETQKSTVSRRRPYWNKSYASYYRKPDITSSEDFQSESTPGFDRLVVHDGRLVKGNQVSRLKIDPQDWEESNQKFTFRRKSSPASFLAATERGAIDTSLDHHDLKQSAEEDLLKGEFGDYNSQMQASGISFQDSEHKAEKLKNTRSEKRSSIVGLRGNWNAEDESDLKKRIEDLRKTVLAAEENRKAAIRALAEERKRSLELEVKISRQKEAAISLEEEVRVLKESHDTLLASLRKKYSSSVAARAAAALLYQDWESEQSEQS